MPDEPVPRFDPLAPDQLADPYPMYARLRREDPVHYAEDLGIWVITRYEDLVNVVLDPATFSSRNALRTSVAPLPPEVQEVLAQGIPPASWLTESDEPQHRRLRSAFGGAFTARRVARMEPFAHRLANELVDEFAQQGRTDLIPSFAWPFPLRVVAEMLGIPPEDVSQLHEWSVSFLRLAQATDPLDQLIEHAKRFVAFQWYCWELCERRDRDPQDDLVSAMFAGLKTADDPLSFEEAVWMPLNLITAGHVTVTRAIANAVDLIFRFPRLREDLLDPDRVDGAVEEIVRLEAPAQGLFRTVTRDAEVAGTRLRAGERVMVHFASASRDEDVFDAADEPDPNRPHLARSLAFGKGIHYCLGAPLARLELRVALPVLLRRLSRLRPDPDDAAQRDTIFFARGFLHMPVVWDLAPAGRP